MKIIFLNNEGTLDSNSINSGVYIFRIGHDGMSETEFIPLYIGQSIWMARRCGKHLYSLLKEPEYFGLTKENIENDNLILSVSILEKTQGNTKQNKLERTNKEVEAIKKLSPLSQNPASDRLIKDCIKRIKKVQTVISQWNI